MASNNTGSNGHVNESDKNRLVDSKGPRFNELERRVSLYEKALTTDQSGDTMTEAGDSNHERTDYPLTESALEIMNATHDNSNLPGRPAGEGSTTQSVIAEPGSPRREAARPTAGTSGRQTLQGLTLDYSADARNILNRANAERPQGPRP